MKKLLLVTTALAVVSATHPARADLDCTSDICKYTTRCGPCIEHKQVTQATPVEQPDTYSFLDIKKAIDLAEENEVRFKRDFAGRPISFTWKFQKASWQEEYKRYNVFFGTGSFSGSVVCLVHDQEQETLKHIIEWNEGHRGTVTGTIWKVWMGNLILYNCDIKEEVVTQ